MGNLNSPENNLEFNFSKSVDLRDYSNTIENEEPFCKHPVAIISANPQGSVLAMNTNFAKEYGYSSSSEALINFQHFARKSQQLLNLPGSIRYCPEKQPNGKHSEEFVRDQCNRAFSSETGSVVFNWTLRDKNQNEKQRSILATCCNFENMFSFQLVILGNKEENLTEQRENDIINIHHSLCIPIHIMDTEYLKSMEKYKPLFSGNIQITAAKPVVKKTPWKQCFCQLDYLGLKLNLFEQQGENSPKEIISLFPSSELVKTSDLSTSTFLQQFPNLMELKGPNQRTLYFSGKDSKTMQSFQYNVIKSVNNRLEHAKRSLHYIVSKHIENVIKFDWMKSFELYYDNHVVNTDNLKEVRVGKPELRRFINEMDRYNWIGGIDEGRRVGRILVSEEKRMSAVEWLYHYRHRKEEGKKGGKEPRRKIMLIVSHWNKKNKILREDVFYPSKVSYSEVPDVEELAKLSFGVEQEMLRDMRKKYKSRTDIETKSTKPTMKRLCQLLFDEGDIMKAAEECYEKSLKFNLSKGGKNICGYSIFHELEKKEVDSLQPVLQFQRMLVEGPLGMLHYKATIKEGNEVKVRHECNLFLIRDNKIVREDRFFE